MASKKEGGADLEQAICNVTDFLHPVNL